MAQESKEVDTKMDQEVMQETLGLEADRASSEAQTNDDAATHGEEEDLNAAQSAEKKKKSKKEKLKKMVGGKGNNEDHQSPGIAGEKLTPGMVDQLLDMNPSLKGELSGMDKSTQAEEIRKLDAADLLSGLVRISP